MTSNQGQTNGSTRNEAGTNAPHHARADDDGAEERMPESADDAPMSADDADAMKSSKTPTGAAKPKRAGRGFAGMDAERQRQIASEGGRAAHSKGSAHEFTPEEARQAGRKGGEAVSQDRRHMSEIGKKGGEARGNNAKAKQQQQPS